MLAILFAAIIPSQADPIALLKEAQQHYTSLKRFEATIEHHNDSGLFPGEYTQKLTWTGKGKFTLNVTKPSDFKPVADKPGGQAPNYAADGKDVIATWPDRRKSTDSVIPRENTSPGWEVSGGLAMSFLEKTHVSKFVIEPPAEYKVVWTMGDTTSWKAHEVRELVAGFGEKGQRMRLYLDRSKPLIIGASAEGGLNGWMIYRDIKAE